MTNSRSKPTVLFIDDDQGILDSYAALLAKTDYNLVFSSSTSDARQKLVSIQPDVAVVDVMLDGGLTGFDLAREIHAKYPKAQIIMLSGLNSELKEPIQFEPDERLPIRKFINKPAKAAHVIAEIEAALR